MLINASEINSLARPCHADERTTNQFIEEAETLDIRKNIGDDLYLSVVATPLQYSDLLNGCIYVDCAGRRKKMVGIKKTLAYYALGRIMRNAGYTPTRFGFVQKNDEYSEQVAVKQRVDAANEVFKIADTFMAECLEYIKSQRLAGCGTALKNNRNQFKIIGR